MMAPFPESNRLDLGESSYRSGLEPPVAETPIGRKAKRRLTPPFYVQ